MQSIRSAQDKQCIQCSAQFKINNEDLAFYDKVSPIFNGKKELIPPPTHCPDCREQRRLSYCNERFFYSGTCGLCSKRMLTEYPPSNGYTIYCRDCWHGDKWDPCTTGRDVDFSRPFMEQVMEVRDATPFQNLLVEGTNVNSDYIHYAGYCKNSYLVMHADFCEDCYYGYGFKHTTSCVDGFYNLTCELCYDCVDVHSCYGLRSCQDCTNCNSSSYLRDCIGCKNCFLCVGLREKEYCFENQQMSKADYEAKMRALNQGSYSDHQAHKSKLEEMGKRGIFKESHGRNTENCTGDYLQNCKNTQKSFDCEDVEDGKFLYQVVTGAKDIYDIYQYGLNLRESYEVSIAGTDAQNICLSHSVHSSASYILYSWVAMNCKNCFGCANIHHKEYCILNKQYTKGEYEALVPKIIDHMRSTGEYGELFPINCSPFGYNKTTAQMYYTLTEEEVIANGWKWDSAQDAPPNVEKIVDAAMLPDSIEETPDDILNWAIRCEITGKPFRVTTPELKFYRQQHIPLPRRSPDQRHLDRFALRNPRTFWQRNCGKCRKDIETTYSPDRPETIYCEECYLEAMY